MDYRLLDAVEPNEMTIGLVLRETEGAGRMTGLDLLNRTARVASRLAASPPNYALLHDLADAGLLERIDGRPPTYAITEAGRAEARRLARAVRLPRNVYSDRLDRRWKV
jgi:DNA-binding PadR family transcriptional regulator